MVEAKDLTTKKHKGFTLPKGCRGQKKHKGPDG